MTRRNMNGVYRFNETSLSKRELNRYEILQYQRLISEYKKKKIKIKLHWKKRETIIQYIKGM